MKPDFRIFFHHSLTKLILFEENPHFFSEIRCRCNNLDMIFRFFHCYLKSVLFMRKIPTRELPTFSKANCGFLHLYEEYKKSWELLQSDFLHTFVCLCYVLHKLGFRLKWKKEYIRIMPSHMKQIARSLRGWGVGVAYNCKVMLRSGEYGELPTYCQWTWPCSPLTIYCKP